MSLELHLQTAVRPLGDPSSSPTAAAEPSSRQALIPLHLVLLATLFDHMLLEHLARRLLLHLDPAPALPARLPGLTPALSLEPQPSPPRPLPTQPSSASSAASALRGLRRNYWIQERSHQLFANLGMLAQHLPALRRCSQRPVDRSHCALRVQVKFTEYTLCSSSSSTSPTCLNWYAFLRASSRVRISSSFAGFRSPPLWLAPCPRSRNRSANARVTSSFPQPLLHLIEESEVVIQLPHELRQRRSLKLRPRLHRQS